MSGATNGGRTRAFEALHESAELHRAVLGSISDAVLLTDDDGAFRFISPNVDVIFGYALDEVQLMGGVGRLIGERLFERARLTADGEIRNIEREIVAKSGDRRTILIHAKRVAIGDGTILLTCRDITERKAAEEQLRVARADLAHAARLGVVGELIGSIVHEITQPLAAVSMNAGAGLRLLDGTDPQPAASLRDVLLDIQSNSQLAGEVIERLRSLVRKQPLRREVLDVNDIVRDLRRLIGTEAAQRGVTFGAELEPRVLAAAVDRVGLRQVVLNLLLNAMDAAVHGASRSVTLHTRRTPELIEILVTDTGPGIPPDNVPRLFDAFFTTKKDGIGLGLTIAKSLAEAQDGHLVLAENSSRGTTFRLTLPAVERAI